MLSEDIAGTLFCNFPYLEAEITCKKGELLEENEKSTLNCPPEAPTAMYLPSGEKQRLQMTSFVVS